MYAASFIFYFKKLWSHGHKTNNDIAQGQSFFSDIKYKSSSRCKALQAFST